MLSSFTLCLTFSVHMEEEVGGGGVTSGPITLYAITHFTLNTS